MTNEVLLANKIACDIFQKTLSRNSAALEYLADRGISKEIITSFRVGYSAPIIQILKSHSLPFEHLATLDGNYEYFTNRLMLPFIDQKDNILGFTSRAFPEQDKKHLHQRGLDISFYNEKDLQNDYILIVESPICCLTLKQYNINCIALCGSSRNHIDRINLKTKVYLVPDIDPSRVGETEFIKFGAKLSTLGHTSIKIIYLANNNTEKVDINSYMLKHSVADLRRLTREAVDIRQHRQINGLNFNELIEKLSKKSVAKENIVNNKLAEIKNKLNIIDVMSEYVSIVDCGSIKACCCPFHNDSKPSCMIYEDTQSFYCFGCNNGGDVIEFIKKIEKVEFKIAVEILYEKILADIPL